MKILFLGPSKRNLSIVDFLLEDENEVYQTKNCPSVEEIEKKSFDLILSSGYHKKIPLSIVKKFEKKIINIHASRLPYGKGIGTAYLSLLFPCPIGVSLHMVDENFDTGDVIAVRDINIDSFLKLHQREFYTLLVDEVNCLFIEYWPLIKSGAFDATENSTEGRNISYFYRHENEKFMEILPLGWDETVEDIMKIGAKFSISEAFWHSLDE